MKRFWDLLSSIPSYAELDRGERIRILRSFSHVEAGGKGHMLFRPVGQKALAAALGALVKSGHKLESLIDKLSRYDLAEGFKLEEPSSPWFMVIYDPNKKRMSVRGESLARRLLEYLLGDGIPDGVVRERLRKDLAEARTIHAKKGDTNNPHLGQAVGFDGEWISPEKIDLPAAIR